MSKYTKIVATISDARCDVDFIKQLYESCLLYTSDAADD